MEEGDPENVARLQPAAPKRTRAPRPPPPAKKEKKPKRDNVDAICGLCAHGGCFRGMVNLLLYAAGMALMAYWLVGIFRVANRSLGVEEILSRAATGIKDVVETHEATQAAKAAAELRQKQQSPAYSPPIVGHHHEDSSRPRSM
jgi:hypothetical protein